MSAEFTRAFVVGIEIYEFGGAWNKLSGPVADAHRFVTWLVDRGVQPKNITVFLSEPSRPLAADVPGLPTSVQRRMPTMASFRHEIIEMVQEAPRWFWLYWGGHGVLYNDEHHLLFSDAQSSSATSLTPNALWHFLRGFPAKVHPEMTSVPRRNVLEHTLMVLDVCSTHAHVSKLHTRLAPLNFGGDVPIHGRNISTLVASRKGEAADNCNEEQTGVLSRELRPLLAALVPGEKWPPDFGEIGHQLHVRFTALRDDGKARQCPALYIDNTPKGTGLFRGMGFDPLLKTLLDAVSAAHPLLPSAVIEEAYRLVAVSRDASLMLDAHPVAAFWVVTHILADEHPPGALLRFVELCRPLLGDMEVKARIRNWQVQVAEAEGMSLDEIELYCTPFATHLREVAEAAGESLLQVVVEPIFGHDDAFQMRAQYRPSGVLHQQPPTNRSQLAQQFRDIFARIRPLGVRRADRIEIALPFELYTLAVDEWTICTGQTASRKLILEAVGKVYPVVLRSYDLAFDSEGYAEPRSLRHSRGPFPRSALAASAVAGSETVDAVLAGNTDIWKSIGIHALVAANFDPSQSLGNDLTMGSELTNAGLSLALWVRKPILPATEIREIQQQLQVYFLDYAPAEWPIRAQLLRQKSSGWAGLNLLWDSYDSPLPLAPNHLSPPDLRTVSLLFP